MAEETYEEQKARLVKQVDELRQSRAPGAWVAEALRSLVELHLENQNLDAARRTVGELDWLRSERDPELEVSHRMAQTQLALAEEEPERALWHSEGAVVIARKHALSSLLPDALLQLAGALFALERNEEGIWAELEAFERYEQLGMKSHAASALYGAALWGPEEGVELVHARALALAQRGDFPMVTGRIAFSLGTTLRDLRRYLPARRAFDVSMQVARSHSPGSISIVLRHQGLCEAEFDHFEAALALATEALEASLTDEERAKSLSLRGTAHLELGEHRKAVGDYAASMRLFSRERQWTYAKDSLKRLLDALREQLVASVRRLFGRA